MKKVLILSVFAGGLLFSCGAEEKNDKKDDAATKEAEAHKAEDAATTKSLDNMSNAAKATADEAAALEAELDAMMTELESL